MTIRVKRRLKSVKDPVLNKKKAGMGRKQTMTAADKKAARLARKRRFESLSAADQKFERERAAFLREKRERNSKTAPVLADMQQAQASDFVSTSAARKRKAGPGDAAYKKVYSKALKERVKASKAARAAATAEMKKIRADREASVKTDPKKAKSIRSKAMSAIKKVRRSRDKDLRAAASDFKKAVNSAHADRNKERKAEGLKPLKRRKGRPKGSTNAPKDTGAGSSKVTSVNTPPKSSAPAKKKRAPGGGRKKGSLNKSTYGKMSHKAATDKAQIAGDSPGKGSSKSARTRHSKKAAYDPMGISPKGSKSDYSSIKDKPKRGRPAGSKNKKK